MILKSFYVNKKYLDQIADWRNQPGMQACLRTNHRTIKKNQVKWCKEIIKSKTDKYFYIIDKGNIVGYCALTHITKVDAEISLLIGLSLKGYGKKAVKGLLEYGFTILNLEKIWGEVYICNPNYDFWIRQGFITSKKLPKRKRYEGKWYSGIIFDMIAKDYREINGN